MIKLSVSYCPIFSCQFPDAWSSCQLHVSICPVVSFLLRDQVVNFLFSNVQLSVCCCMIKLSVSCCPTFSCQFPAAWSSCQLPAAWSGCPFPVHVLKFVRFLLPVFRLSGSSFVNALCAVRHEFLFLTAGVLLLSGWLWEIKFVCVVCVCVCVCVCVWGESILKILDPYHVPIKSNLRKNHQTLTCRCCFCNTYNLVP